MAEINFRNLVSTESGAGATTGRETAKFFNENFRITKENLEAIWEILQDMVGSKNIEGIRVKPYYDSEDYNSILGYFLEYTDNVDLTVDEDYRPLNVRWQDLIGSPYLNTVLAQILASKVDVVTFQPVSNQVDLNTAAISKAEDRLDILEESQVNQDLEISDLQQSTKKLEQDIQFKVDLFKGEASVYNGMNGTDYKFGDVIDTFPSGTGQFVMVTGIDNNGSITDAQYLPNVSEASLGHILINISGQGYNIGDVIPVKEYSIIVGGVDYKINDIVQSANGNFYKVTGVDGTGSVLSVLPTQITVVDTNGYSLDIDDSVDSTSTYAQITQVGANGEIEDAIVAEGPNIEDSNSILGTNAILFYTYGTGAQISFHGYNTIMFRYNTDEPVAAGDPPKGLIYSIADGAPGSWKSFVENIPFSNLISIKKTIDYTYNTLTITNPSADELLPYAYGYSVGDKISLKGIDGLTVTIQSVDDNGTPTSFTPETFYADDVLSDIYNTSVQSNSWFNSVLINSPGAGYQVGDTFKLDNLTDSPTFTVTSVDSNGGIQSTNPSSFTTTTDISGPYYAHAIPGRTDAIVYISSSSGNAAYGLRFKVESTPITTNTEFNSFIEDLIKALKGSWNSDISEYNFVLDQKIAEKADQADLSQHLGDVANPHNVTKDQIGLDAVDNTPDMEKPISIAAQERFTTIESSIKYLPKSIAISRDGYNDLASNFLLDDDSFYFVTRGNPPFSVNFAIYAGGTGYVVNDTFTVIGSYNPNFVGVVSDVDADGAVTGFSITNIVTQVDFDISGLYQTTTDNYGTGLIITIDCDIID